MGCPSLQAILLDHVHSDMLQGREGRLIAAALNICISFFDIPFYLASGIWALLPCRLRSICHTLCPHRTKKDLSIPINSLPCPLLDVFNFVMRTIYFVNFSYMLNYTHSMLNCKHFFDLTKFYHRSIMRWSSIGAYINDEM